MTGKVVSLSKARKGKARDAKKSRADANAVKFGLTRAERMAEQAAADRAVRALDGHKREDE